MNMIKFKDKSGNTVRVRPEDIRVMIEANPLQKVNPNVALENQGDAIIMTGINSIVEHDVFKDILSELLGESRLHGVN